MPVDNFPENFVNHLDEVDLVSFDVFDTLLWRDVDQPADLFFALQPSNNQIKSDRVIAEKRARKKASPRQEITLEEIYNDPSLAGLQLDRELELEQLAVSYNPEIYQLLSHAKSAGKKIAALSDCYLDQQFVTLLLEKAGFPRFDIVLVSSSQKKTKISGELFKLLLEKSQIKSEKILHVGDNYKADYLTPRALGFKALRYAPIAERLIINQRLVNKLRNNSPSLSSSLYLSLITKASYAHLKGKSYWFRFGFIYGGIVAYSYANWLIKSAKKASIQNLYLLARDGEILEKIIKLLASNDISTHYLLASRRMFLVANLEKIDQETLKFLTSGSQKTAAEYWKRLTIGGKEDLKFFLSKLPSHFRHNIISGKIAINKLRNAFSECQELIIKLIKDEKKNIFTYVKESGLLEKDSLALVDLGWGGSTQYFIEKLTKKNYPGFYFATNKSAKINADSKSYLFHLDAPVHISKIILECPELVEFIFSGTTPSIKSVDVNDTGVVTPIYNLLTQEEERRILISKELQQGILNFVDSYHPLIQKYGCEIDKNLPSTVVEALIKHPNDEDLLHLSSLEHSSEIGEGKYYSLTGIQSQTYSLSELQLASLKTLFSKSLSNIFWPSGLAKGILRNRLNFISICLTKIIFLCKKLSRARQLGILQALTKFLS
jgi:HAD superfamily hydrolase (TIGR01549 family)